MDTCLQDTASVLENERRTLQWVRNKTATIPSLNDLYQSAEDSFHRFNSTHGMRVYLKWPVPHGKDNGDVLWIDIGGLIDLNDDGGIDNATYFLCISRKESDSSRSRVLRKYHFDYASSETRANGRSSVFHLQYPGTLPPNLEDEYEDGHMDPWLEEPRVFFLPMSLSLVLHMAFREFPGKYTDRLCEDGAWQGTFVRRDQTKLIVPFLEKCLNVAKDDGKLLWDVACEP